MSNINSIIGNNIQKLRKARGISQLELADHFNYSDKAVSKWERGESLPSIATLDDIAAFFNVPLTALISEKEDFKTRTEVAAKSLFHNKKIITSMSAILMYLIATLIFVVLQGMNLEVRVSCLPFLYAIPASLIVLLVMNSIWFSKRNNFIIISLLLWSVLLAIHITLLIMNINFWYIYFLGIPGEIIIILWSRLKFGITKKK